MKSIPWRALRLSSPVLALACEAAFAQATPSPRLEPVVVTATRTAVPLRDVLADVTVIDRDALERQGAGGIADVLRTVPGFEMVRNGGPAANTSIYVRGGETRYTAVLIDGVRVDTQTTGGATWESIPLSQIDRIEVLRGPASSVYGSDAMGGVVQIFTRKGEGPPRVEVGVLAGAQATLNTDVAVAGSSGRLDYAASAASLYSDGHDARSTGNPDRDGHRAQGGSARLGLRVTDAHRVEVSLLRNRVESQYDGVLPAADEIGTHVLSTARAAWTSQWSKAWTSALSLGQSTEQYVTTPDPYFSKTRVRTGTWQNDIALGAHSVNATLEHRDNHLVNNGLLDSAERSESQLGVALGYGWRAGGVGLQANARHDRYSQFGSVQTGSLGMGLDLAPGWRLQSSVGNAFRAPTLYQRFSDSGPVGQTLLPERSRSNMEVALHHKAGSFASSATAYRNRMAELIVFTSHLPAPAPRRCSGAFGCYDNVGDALLQGVTLASTFQQAGWRVSGSLDFQSPKNLDTGKLLQRRSRQHGALSIDRELGDTTLGMQWIAFGQRFEDAANRVKLGSYAVCNLDVQHRLSPTLRLQGRIENAFDRQYETARGYNPVPMSMFIGLRWSPQP